MAGPPNLDTKPSLIWNQEKGETRQPRSCIAYATIFFNFYHAFHVLYFINLLATPGEGNHAFENHPGCFFALAFLSIVSVTFSGLRLILNGILVGTWLDTMSTVQDIVMIVYLTFSSTTLLGDILSAEGIPYGNFGLLLPAVVMYSAVFQHLFRLLLRFQRFTKWKVFAKWDQPDVSTIVKLLHSAPKEQVLYLYGSFTVCLSSLFVNETHVLVASEEWADLNGHSQTYVDIEFFRKSVLFMTIWCCFNNTIQLVLPSPNSIFSPTSLYSPSISLCYPKLRQLCSSLDLVASVLMFSFAAAKSIPLFQMEPKLLCTGQTSWISVAFWARQFATVTITLFTGFMFLMIRRERSLVHSLTTVTQIRKTIAHTINGPNGIKFLVWGEYTDEEMMTLVGLPGLTERGRDRVVACLYSEREMYELLERARNNMRAANLAADNEDSDVSENWSTPSCSSDDSDLELGLGVA